MQDFRPMSISQILDVTFRLYRERFTTFLIIALVVYVPFSILIALFSLGGSGTIAGPGGVQMMNPTGMILGGLGFLVLMVIFLPLCAAALTENISAAYLGRNLTATDSYQRAVPRLGALIGTQLLIGIVVAVMWAIVGVLFYLLGYIAFVVAIIAFVATIILMLSFYVIVPIVVLEGSSGTAALGRSRELMKGNLGKAFGLGFVVGIIGAIFGAILGFVVALIPWPSHMLAIFIQNLANAFVLPIQTAPILLLYYDLRIRKEAFDLQMLASAVEQQPATV